MRRHYRQVARETACPTPLDLSGLQSPLVVVPIKGWDNLAHKGLRFALKLSPDVLAVHIATDEATADDLRRRWPELVEAPARAAGHEPPELVILPSPYRQVFDPLLDYIDDLKEKYPGPPDRDHHPVAGRASLDPLPAAQPAGRGAEGAPAGARRPAHRRHQRALVYVGVMARPGARP